MNNHFYSNERYNRRKETAEFFTPNATVVKMLERLDIDWCNPPQDKTFLDPTCGSGNFLVELASRDIPIKNLYGLDLMQDNVDMCKKRLREIFLRKNMNLEDINYHLDRNIVQGDALKNKYNFWNKKEEF